MKKILIVDDDPEILLIVKSILQSCGFDVLANPSCINLAAMVESYCPDLILLDVRLCGDKGDEICEELKEIYTIPILLFSTNSDEQIIRDSKSDGLISNRSDFRKLANSVKFYLN